MPAFNEAVFLLPREKMLIVTDLGIHICEDSPFSTRFLFKAMGMFKRLGWSKLEKKLFVRNNKTFSTSVEKIIAWNFDKIILAHGQIVKQNGREIFKKAFL